MLFEVLKLIVKKKKKKKKKKKNARSIHNGCYHMVQQSTHSALGACIYLLTILGLSTLLVLSFSKQVGPGDDIYTRYSLQSDPIRHVCFIDVTLYEL